MPNAAAVSRAMGRVRALLCAAALPACLLAGTAASLTAQDTPDTAPVAPPVQHRGPMMFELSLGRTSMPGITSSPPVTVAAGIGTGVWIANRVMLGAEARAHGTVDIEESVPSVRFLSGVVAWRPTTGRPVVRAAYGPAWVGDGERRAIRTTGYALSFEVPMKPALTEPSVVWFARYSTTATVGPTPSRSLPFRVQHVTLGVRLEL